jgi:tRNA 2-thiouridine synthesizing protein A
MATVDLSTIRPAKTADARAMACPGPLLEAKKSISTVKVGEILEIWSGDPGTKNDMPAWCNKVGHEFLGVIAADGYDRLFICRKK